MKTILLTEREDGTYRQMSRGERDRRMAAGRIRLAGVDGDEAAGTVTRWYRLDSERIRNLEAELCAAKIAASRR